MSEANRNSPKSGGKASRKPISSGDRFGRLVSVDNGHLVQRQTQRETYVHVICDCGVAKEVRAASLRSGVTKSCGCGIVDSARVGIVERSTTHGMSKTAIYGVYRTMLSRCYNPKVERYPIYGGRGIAVCERWRGEGGFERFLEDMGTRPSGCSIERIDSDGNYEPSNCRWATPREQANNTGRNRRIVWNGKERTLAEWAREINIKAITINMRLKSGWSVEKALSTPLRGSI